MVVLTVEGIDCYYGSTKILDQVSFSVKNHDFVGLLGPNGSGKTTLLRSISKTLKPHLGAILLDGTDIYTLKSTELAQQLAVVPQDTAISFEFTALDIVLMGRNPYLGRFQLESVKDFKIAKRMMELTNTWQFAHRSINELSGGEKQRVIIARALTQESKVLLLDEPTTHLDINNQLEIMDLLKELCNRQDLTILAVFHDFNLAARYCTFLLLLNKGNIVSAGSPETVLTTKNIKEVFHVDTIVKSDKHNAPLYVIPAAKPILISSKKTNMAVHLICGAGTGSNIMPELVNRGYHVTAGVLNALDTDHRRALELDIPVITEAPFAPISNDAYHANVEQIGQVDFILVTDVPFGPGNLLNLETAKRAIDRGVLTGIIKGTSIEERDFTAGKAQQLLQYLIAKGAILVETEEELFNLLENLGKIKKQKLD